MSGEKRWEIWQQGSGGVGGREYLSGWHSNTVSINVSGHLLNQATAAQRDSIRLSLSWNGQSVQQCIKKSGGNGIKSGNLMKLRENKLKTYNRLHDAEPSEQAKAENTKRTFLDQDRLLLSENTAHAALCRSAAPCCHLELNLTTASSCRLCFLGPRRGVGHSFPVMSKQTVSRDWTHGDRAWHQTCLEWYKIMDDILVWKQFLFVYFNHSLSFTHTHAHTLTPATVRASGTTAWPHTRCSWHPFLQRDYEQNLNKANKNQLIRKRKWLEYRERRRFLSNSTTTITV